MDNKQFITKLARQSSLDYKETARLIQSVADVMLQIMEEGDALSIPSFGTFSVVKEEEKISRNISTGKTVLSPPSLTMAFTESSMLSKRINNKD